MSIRFERLNVEYVTGEVQESYGMNIMDVQTVELTSHQLTIVNNKIVTLIKKIKNN